MAKKVQVLVDGEKQNFEVIKPKKSKKKSNKLRIHQNEGLFTSEWVEAVRKLGRWPKGDETIGENSAGRPCVVDKNGLPVTRR